LHFFEDGLQILQAGFHNFAIQNASSLAGFWLQIVASQLDEFDVCLAKFASQKDAGS